MHPDSKSPSVHPIPFGIVWTHYPILFFPNLSNVQSVRLDGANLVLKTRFGIAILNELPVSLVDSIKAGNKVLMIGIDSLDRPCFFGCYQKSSQDNYLFLTKDQRIANEVPSAFLRKTFSEESLSVANSPKYPLSQIGIYLRRVEIIRSHRKLLTGEIEWTNHLHVDSQSLINLLPRIDEINNPNFNIDSENVDHLSIFSILKELGIGLYYDLFSNSPGSGNTLVAASCLIGDGVPSSIALASDSMFKHSFSEVYASLCCASMFGSYVARELVYQIIAIKSKTFDFGTLSLDINSRDSKDALYMVADLFKLDAAKQDLIPKTKKDRYVLSLRLASHGLGEWMHRHGVEMKKAVGRSTYVDMVTSSLVV